MAPSSKIPFWIMHNGRVIPRRPRHFLREQDEKITADLLVKQVNAVPDRPTQTPNDVKCILKALLWTALPDGGTQRQKCWNITNHRDANIRVFGYKQLIEFLPTLLRQQSWYSSVYNCPELCQCAKCGQMEETQEHIYACADHSAVEECFRNKYEALWSKKITPISIRTLRPWRLLGWLQGRVHPQWEIIIPMLQQGQGTTSTAATIILLLRTSLETWYEAVWLPRCQRTIDQERRLGLHQGTKLRRMREENRSRMNAHPSPTPNLPRSQLSGQERRTAYDQLNSELMGSTNNWCA
jgi:hypothetical protein